MTCPRTIRDPSAWQDGGRVDHAHRVRALRSHGYRERRVTRGRPVARLGESRHFAKAARGRSDPFHAGPGHRVREADVASLRGRDVWSWPRAGSVWDVPPRLLRADQLT